MYKVVIFDFFDVVHRDHQKAWLAKHGFKREGGFAEASDLLDHGRIDFEEYLTRYGKLSNLSAKEVRREFESFATVDDKVVEIIRELKKHYRTGLLSNAHSDELRPILTRHSLLDLFDEVIISSEAAVAKPDPEAFNLILEKLDAGPEEAIFIDDNPDNVAGASRLGIRGVVFESAAKLRSELAGLGIDISG